MENERFQKAVIDKKVSLIKVLETYGVVRVGEYVVGRTCFCCFHENTDTKAAKIYDDERGEALFCFAEQRLYRSSDALSRFTNIPLPTAFNKVWSRLSEDEKHFFEDSYGEVDFISDDWKSILSKIDGFRRGKMSISDVQKELLMIMEPRQ